MTEFPKVFGKEELKHLDNNVYCEMCKRHMHDHEWAVLNYDGFAIFCSNLTFESEELPEVVALEYYRDDPEPEVYKYGRTEPKNVKRTFAMAVKRAEAEVSMNDGPYPHKVEVSARRITTFSVVDPALSIKIGNWEESDVQNVKS